MKSQQARCEILPTLRWLNGGGKLTHALQEEFMTFPVIYPNCGKMIIFHTMRNGTLE